MSNQILNKSRTYTKYTYTEGTPDVMDTPIHEAIRMGDTRELQCLLKQGNYSVDGEGSLLWTPLQEAVNVADIDMVKLLLKYGANPQLRDSLVYRLPSELAQEKHQSSEFNMITIIDLLNSSEWLIPNDNTASICEISSVYVRCHLRPDLKGKTKRKTKRVNLPERVATNSIASSTRPDTICFDDVIVYDGLCPDMSDLLLDVELCALQWTKGWFGKPKKHSLASLKLDVPQAVATMHRETYDLKPCRHQLPPSVQCYYVPQDRNSAHSAQSGHAFPPGTPPPAFETTIDGRGDEEGTLTSIKVEGVETFKIGDHAICKQSYENSSHIVDLAAVHF